MPTQVEKKKEPEDFEHKYVYLTRKYGDDRWLFILDDAELELWKKDNSFEDGDIIIEVGKFYRVCETVVKTINLLEVKK